MPGSVREDTGVHEWLAQCTSRMQSDWGEGVSMGGLNLSPHLMTFPISCHINFLGKLVEKGANGGHMIAGCCNWS